MTTKKIRLTIRDEMTTKFVVWGRLFMFAVLSITCLACEKSKEQEAQQLVREETAPAPTDTKLSGTLKDSGVVFMHRNRLESCSLNLSWISAHEVKFQFSIARSKPSCGDTIIGIAKILNANMDPETDDDEDGAYPVDEYSYESRNKYLFLRIASDRSKVRVILENVDCKHDESLLLRTEKGVSH